MLLHEIISINDQGTKSMLVEKLANYKKSLYVYYKDQFNCEPVLLVTDIFNAAQYALIVPSDELDQAIETYLQDSDMTEQEKEEQTELICSQSIMLKDF